MPTVQEDRAALARLEMEGCRRSHAIAVLTKKLLDSQGFIAHCGSRDAALANLDEEFGWSIFTAAEAAELIELRPALADWQKHGPRELYRQATGKQLTKDEALDRRGLTEAPAKQ